MPNDGISLPRDFARALSPTIFATDLGYTLDPWQSDLAESDQKQIAVCAARQTGKDFTTAIKAVHRAWYHPNTIVLCCAPAQRQAKLWFDAAAAIIRRVDEKAEMLERDNALSCSFKNGSRLFAIPSEPSNIRGFSAVSMTIVSECAFLPIGDDEKLFAALTPMLAVSQGQLILISSANGQAGYFFSVFQNGGDDWWKLTVTVDQCSRIPREFLEREKRNKLPWQFEQEFYCRWASSENAFLDFETIRSAYSDTTVKPLWAGADLVHIARSTHR